MWATVRANIIKYLANKHRLNNRNTLLSSVGGYSLTASTLYILLFYCDVWIWRKYRLFLVSPSIAWYVSSRALQLTCSSSIFSIVTHLWNHACNPDKTTFLSVAKVWPRSHASIITVPQIFGQINDNNNNPDVSSTFNDVEVSTGFKQTFIFLPL